MITIVAAIAVYGLIGTLGFLWTDSGLRRKEYPPCPLWEIVTYIAVWPVYLSLVYLAEYH